MSKEKYQKVLSKHILEVALYLQRYRDFLLSRKNFYKNSDWWDLLREEFYNPKFKIRIIKSEGNFRKLLGMQITEEIMRTPFKQLTKHKLEGIGIRVK